MLNTVECNSTSNGAGNGGANILWSPLPKQAYFGRRCSNPDRRTGPSVTVGARPYKEDLIFSHRLYLIVWSFPAFLDIEAIWLAEEEKVFRYFTVSIITRFTRLAAAIPRKRLDFLQSSLDGLVLYWESYDWRWTWVNFLFYAGDAWLWLSRVTNGHLFQYKIHFSNQYIPFCLILKQIQQVLILSP